MGVVGSWILGLSMVLLNSLLSAVGYTLQRKAHVDSEMGGLSPRGVRRNRTMLSVGVALYVVASAPDVIAFLFIPEVVCSAMSCLRLVFIVLAARFYLGDSICMMEIVGMVTASLGTILMVCFGPRSQGTLKQAEDPKVITYLVAAAGALVFLLFVEHMDVLRCWRRRCAYLQKFTLPFAATLAYSVEKVMNSLLGIIGAPKDFYLNPKWDGMVILISLLGLIDLYLNMRGVKRMPMQVFVPVVFALTNVTLYFQSAWVFEAFHEMSWLNIGMSSAGAGLALIGALLLQPPRIVVEKVESVSLERAPSNVAPLVVSPEDERT